MKVAAIDIGSNSILLTIVERLSPDTSAKDLKILVDECEVCGLVKNMKDGQIASDALERATNALQKYRELLSQFQVDSLQVVATESLRRPKNGEAVRKILEKTIGSPIEIISGDREAELSFWSVEKEYKTPGQSKLVFDVGGASTEIVFGNESGIIEKESLKVGSVLLTEKFNLDDPSIPDEAVRYVCDLVQSTEVFRKASTERCIGVGVAGTMTCLIAVQDSILEYSRDETHLKQIKREDVFKWLRRVLMLPAGERKKIAGLPANRADVFGGGVAIVYGLMKAFDWDNVVCMDSGVRFGLIYENLL